ncbi:Hypothetical predicted protein [Octopus vulgaris]|uniref:Uncharacterized protein n=1 Tax=Octopus vulgaris TaxID=6645 RepID=A0AA36F4U9_OCTVU|nr:Hypothetical predicted protein [Octopus vulgaris]
MLKNGNSIGCCSSGIATGMDSSIHSAIHGGDYIGCSRSYSKYSGNGTSCSTNYSSCDGLGRRNRLCYSDNIRGIDRSPDSHIGGFGYSTSCGICGTLVSH